jgi:hypothetical protein
MSYKVSTASALRDCLELRWAIKLLESKIASFYFLFFIFKK